MRIIAGKFKGRPLVSFKADHIRPTTDRVKEVIFNMLQFEIEGARVTDLFSGTGNLALEALSRGAARVTAVELSKKSVAIIKKNQKLLGVDEALKIVQSDVRKFLRNEPEASDIVLIDPPFTEEIADEIMGLVAQSSLLHPGTVIFIESRKQEKLMESYGPVTLKSQKNFGDKLLSQFVVTGELARASS